MSFVRFTALCLLCVGVLSKPFGSPIRKRQDATTTTTTSAEDAQSTACGDIVVAYNNNYTVFYADDVFDCLQSVPFNPAVATRFIQYWNTTLQFQSTLEYLKDPPQEYQQPSFDVMQALQGIQNNVTAGNYKNEYSFEADVQLLINRIHDAHVVLGAGILQPFAFASPYGIVSASPDGKQVPQVYISDHVKKCQSLGCTPSPITQINGIDVVEYLSTYAEINSLGYLEPHADWNALMDSPALDIQGGLSVFQSGTFYPGDELEFTIKDQDSIDTWWLAIFNELQATGPLSTGGDFYNFYVLGLLPASYDPTVQWWETFPPDNSSTSGNDTDYPPPNCSSGTQNWCEVSDGGYPANPIVAQDDLTIVGGGVVSGYLFDDISTAVFSIPTFYQYGDNTQNFQDAVTYFIQNASAANTSHIIIDLQQNAGGTVFLAIETFKQFFYSIDPYAASRIRIHDFANILGEAYTQWWEGLQQDLDDEANADNYAYYAASEWVVTNRINIATGRNFSSWEEYAGPVRDHDDLFSLPQRYNLSDEVFDSSAFDDWIPFGYADDQNSSYPQYWSPEDIVILTDGTCSSSCALFVELMSHQAGVRTIVAGGRPVKGPQQAVAGSRGARLYSDDALNQDISDLNDYVQNETAYQLLNRSDSGMRISYAGFTIADAVRADDNTPLQFKYEAADCRIYYTLANVYNFTRLWHDVATAAWFDTSLCVEDSTGYPSARNTTSPKTPPARTAQAPGLNLDHADQVNINVNDTAGLVDAHRWNDPGELSACNTDADCTGSIECLPITVRCKGKQTPIKACLPVCSTDSDCVGINTFCDPESSADAKRNGATFVSQGTTGAKGQGTTLGGNVFDGHCKPSGQVGTLRLCGKK